MYNKEYENMRYYFAFLFIQFSTSFFEQSYKIGVLSTLICEQNEIHLCLGQELNFVS